MADKPHYHTQHTGLVHTIPFKQCRTASQTFAPDWLLYQNWHPFSTKMQNGGAHIHTQECVDIRRCVLIRKRRSRSEESINLTRQGGAGYFFRLHTGKGWKCWCVYLITTVNMCRIKIQRFVRVDGRIGRIKEYGSQWLVDCLVLENLSLDNLIWIWKWF